MPREWAQGEGEREDNHVPYGILVGDLLLKRESVSLVGNVVKVREHFFCTTSSRPPLQKS